MCAGMILMMMLVAEITFAGENEYWPSGQVFERTSENELVLRDVDFDATGHYLFLARAGETNDQGQTIAKEDLDAWQAQLLFAKDRDYAVKVTYNDDTGQVQSILGPGYFD